jgi:hypothetical protein
MAAGLDVYSLNTSTQTVISYLERVDPEAAKVAKQRYSCFDRSTHALPNRPSLQPCSDDALAIGILLLFKAECIEVLASVR